MPRLPRIYIKGALYYVTCRSESNQEIFKDEGDYQMFLELLKKYKEQYGIKIFAYSLMPNHLHLLIEMAKEIKPQEGEAVKSQEISDFMHNLNNSYTKYFNGRYQRKGHLFRERFKAAIVEKQGQLLNLTAYVHLNPEKLNMVIEAKDYPHSSYSLYLYNKDLTKTKGLDLSQEIAEVTSLLQNKDYAEFVSGMTDNVRSLLHKSLQRGGVLGSEEFIKQVKSQIADYKTKADSQEVKGGARKYKLVLTAGGVLIVFLIGAGGTYMYLMNKKAGNFSIAKPPAAVQPKQESWDILEWDVKLVAVGGGNESMDTLNFYGGKFTSAKLNSLGYQSSNYSTTIESNGKVIWETIQSVPAGLASWHGEIEQDKMTGVLSLRQEGKAPQDFSFISTGYRRRK